jgi:hypothetical protein
MDDVRETTESAGTAREVWEAPTLIVHGGFHELTRFTAGTGPDDGLFDPGSADSQV